MIKNSKNNKSPGCDGLPWEFYKIFYRDISTFLLRSLNDAFTKKKKMICLRLSTPFTLFMA